MPEKTSSLTFSITRHYIDKRFDTALFMLLQEQHPEKKLFSRGFVTRMIQTGGALLNGSLTKPSTTVTLHDTIQVRPEALLQKTATLQPNSELRVDILFEDDEIIVINKSGSLQTHPAGKHVDDTLANWIITKYPALQKVGDNPLRPGIVHRLDRETSGVLVIAKTNANFARLKKLFQERQMHKSYYALVYGHIAIKEDSIDRPLTRKKGELKRRVIDQEQETSKLTGSVRSAITDYRVIARYHDFDLVLVTPKTGRTHQIRAHMASIGHPIVGDKLYAFKLMQPEKALFPERHMLHARRLSWQISDRDLSFQAPLPEDFRKILSSIDETLETSYDDEALKSLLSE